VVNDIKTMEAMLQFLQRMHSVVLGAPAALTSQ